MEATKKHQSGKNSTIDIEDSKMIWNEQNGLIWSTYSQKIGSTKIASFDMDHTLVKPKSGAKFPKNRKDWTWWHPKVKPKLQQLHSEGFRIVIFTNQGGISKGKQRKSDITGKMEDVQKDLKIPITAYIAPEQNQYRKPSIGMWEHLVSKNNEKHVIDIVQSFYCGDGAGRPKTKFAKKDFSNSDYLFALNVGLPFFTPEHLFFGQKYKLPSPKFNPNTLSLDLPLFEGGKKGDRVDADGKEVIIFVGSPASGKSTFWKQYLSHYERVNQDTLKTKEKCLKVMEQHLKEGKSVVIDNTNPRAQRRNYYYKKAHDEYNYPVRCFYFKRTKEMVFHNDQMRVSNKNHKHLSKKAGRIPIHTFFKYLEYPKLSEGFSEIKVVNNVPSFFENEKDKKEYFMTYK